PPGAAPQAARAPGRHRLSPLRPPDEAPRVRARGERLRLETLRVRPARRRVPTNDQGLVRAGALTLDLARRQARIGDLVTDLSDREFRVLHHLVEHAGEV